jgi:UMF1 family MFS transporter
MTATTVPVTKANAPATKREIFSWALFDFANSSFTTVVITAVYSRFFTEQIVPKESGLRDTYWSAAIVIATVIALLLSPLLGLMSDLAALKKHFLVLSAVVCSSATAALYFAAPGEITIAIFCIVIASVGFMFSENFCASFLPEIATPSTMSKISGMGWAVGYFGGLASLVIVMFLVSADPATELPRYVSQTQLAMVATGGFFMVAATPAFLFLKNRQRPRPGYETLNATKLVNLASSAMRDFVHSLGRIRERPGLAGFFLAFMVYMAGMDAVIKFVGIYASSELRLTGSELTILFLELQLSAAAGAFGFGFLEAKLGPKRNVELSLVLWIIGILMIFLLPNLESVTGLSQKSLFLGIALLTGTALGATQSSSRAIVGLLTPASESGEMFGYWGFFMKLATILGMLFGVTSDALGSRRMALLLVLAFFILGIFLLARVKLPSDLTKERGVS